MELKPGYKQTEVGVIPEDWDLKNIGGFVTLKRGHDLTWRDRRDGDIPIMGSAGPNGFHDTALAKGPGVVLGRSGASFGQAHYCELDFWPHNTALYVTDFKGNNPLFAYFLFSLIDFSSHNSGGAQQSLNRNFIAPIGIGVPSPEEQGRLAKALSDVDELIKTLEELISKKRNIKQATMQELLTGKRRLPGFEGEWEVKRLGDIATIDPENLHRNTHPHYRFNYISLEDVDQGSLLSWSEQKFSTSPSRARRRLRRNDVLVSTVRPNLMSHLLFSQDNGDWVCSTGFALLRCNGELADPSYVFFHLFSAFINKQIEGLLTGSNYPAISSRDVRSLEIPAPALSEQKEIARILASMEDEIISLTQRLEKARLLKQGMMQQLLTGKIRLVSSDAKEAFVC